MNNEIKSEKSKISIGNQCDYDNVNKLFNLKTELKRFGMIEDLIPTTKLKAIKNKPKDIISDKIICKGLDINPILSSKFLKLNDFKFEELVKMDKNIKRSLVSKLIGIKDRTSAFDDVNCNFQLGGKKFDKKTFEHLDNKREFSGLDLNFNQNHEPLYQKQPKIILKKKPTKINNPLINSQLNNDYTNIPKRDDKEKNIQQENDKILIHNVSKRSILSSTGVKKLIDKHDRETNTVNKHNLDNESNYFFSDSYFYENDIFPNDNLAINKDIKTKNLRVGIVTQNLNIKNSNIARGKHYYNNHVSLSNKKGLNINNSRLLSIDPTFQQINFISKVNRLLFSNENAKHNLKKLGFPQTRLNKILYSK